MPSDQYPSSESKLTPQEASEPDCDAGMTRRPLLEKYTSLGSPNPQIVKYTILTALPLCTLYALLGYFIPRFPSFFFHALQILFKSEDSYNFWIQGYLTINSETFWNRLTLVSYLSLYFGSWWAYFRSKYSIEANVEAKRLKIQTLRRLLGITSAQWNQNREDTNNKEIVDSFRRKGEVGMLVIAVLIASTVLIFDQISNIWRSGNEHTLWQITILWIGMLSLVVSFVCLMLCVDSLDTMFNKFLNDPIRNTLVRHFYDFTINPRYLATAALFFSMVLLLAYHSESLASLSIGAIVYFGYNLWYPNLDYEATLAGLKIDHKPRRFKTRYVIILFGLPLAVRAVTLLLNA